MGLLKLTVSVRKDSTKVYIIVADWEEQSKI